MAKRWNFGKAIKRVKSMKRAIPAKIGIIMKNHFFQSFRKGGFTDAVLNPWKVRKAPQEGRRRAILVESGDLKKSIRVRSASFKRIRVGSYGIPYARTHNRGLDGMPKRQFIGPSKIMSKKITKLINLELRKAFR